MQIQLMYLSHRLMITRAHLLWNSFSSLFSDLIVVLNYVAYFERKKYGIERWSVKKITGKVEHYRYLMMSNRLLPFPIQITEAIYYLTRVNKVCVRKIQHKTGEIPITYQWIMNEINNRAGTLRILLVK